MHVFVQPMPLTHNTFVMYLSLNFTQNIYTTKAIHYTEFLAVAGSSINDDYMYLIIEWHSHT